MSQKLCKKERDGKDGDTVEKVTGHLRSINTSMNSSKQEVVFTIRPIRGDEMQQKSEHF